MRGSHWGSVAAHTPSGASSRARRVNRPQATKVGRDPSRLLLAPQLRHTPLPPYTQARSSPHLQFQNSLFADIYSALPQPDSLPRPGQCSGKGGSLPPKGWGFSPNSPVLGPHRQPQSGPYTLPAPRLRLGRSHTAAAGGRGVGNAGAEASHLPPCTGGLWGTQRTKQGSSPVALPPPPPLAGEVGSEGRGSALQGQGKLRWAAGWGRGRQNPCILP